ncbi:MAG: hypothetical protein M0018_01880 [Nitrospiraceae bacterium]|nr:hypothetical protein [Nitrospiraceae bacterium]
MGKKLLAIIALLLLPLSFAFADEHSNKMTLMKGVPAQKFIMPRPPIDKGLWPCSQCHKGMPPGPKRKLTMMHQDIVLKHMPGGWCYDCHNPTDRDKLRLFTGESVSFDQSYLVCGQCHGFIFQEWKHGLHGKRVGMWNGVKTYYQCINCHWPHEPHFKPIVPWPAPIKPADIKYGN